MSKAPKEESNSDNKKGFFTWELLFYVLYIAVFFPTSILILVMLTRPTMIGGPAVFIIWLPLVVAYPYARRFAVRDNQNCDFKNLALYIFVYAVAGFIFMSLIWTWGGINSMIGVDLADFYLTVLLLSIALPLLMESPFIIFHALQLRRLFLADR